MFRSSRRKVPANPNFCTLLQWSYTPFKPSSALPIDNPHRNFRSPLLLLLFSPRAAVRLLPRVAWSSLFSDVTKRQLYHRVLNCTSVVIPGRLYPLKYYSPLQYGNGRAEGEDRTYRGFGGRTLDGMRFLGRRLRGEGRGKTTILSQGMLVARRRLQDCQMQNLDCFCAQGVLPNVNECLVSYAACSPHSCSPTFSSFPSSLFSPVSPTILILSILTFSPFPSPSTMNTTNDVTF